MQKTSWIGKTSLLRAVVLGVSLAPVALLAQQATAPDAQGTTQSTTQDQQAQGPRHHGHGDPAERQAHMLKMLTKKLDLTPDQVTQVQGIQSDSASQMQAVRSDTTTAKADRRSKMMDIHKTEQEKIRAVLNDQQKTKFDAMVARRQSHMHGHEGDAGAPDAQ